MSGRRIHLSGERATAFDKATENRREYIRAERLDQLADGGESVHYPGCPECGVPAKHVVWSTYDRGPGGLLEIDLGTCGHRFIVSPVPTRFDPDGFWWHSED